MRRLCASVMFWKLLDDPSSCCGSSQIVLAECLHRMSCGAGAARVLALASTRFLHSSKAVPQKRADKQNNSKDESTLSSVFIFSNSM